MAKSRKKRKKRTVGQATSPPKPVQKELTSQKELKAEDDLDHFGERTFKIIPTRLVMYGDKIMQTINTANALAEEGQFEKAEAMLKELIARKPRIREAHLNLGLVYNKRGDKEAAIAIFEQAIKKFPSTVIFYLNLADTYLSQGNIEAARTQLRALEKTSEFTGREFYNYVRLWSDLFAAKGEYEKASFCLELIRTVMPDAPSLWRRRIRYRLGRLFGR